MMCVCVCRCNIYKCKWSRNKNQGVKKEQQHCQKWLWKMGCSCSFVVKVFHITVPVKHMSSEIDNM